MILQLYIQSTIPPLFFMSNYGPVLLEGGYYFTNHYLTRPFYDPCGASRAATQGAARIYGISGHLSCGRS